MKKEKKKKARIRSATAILWRISVLVLALWLAAMSYITVIAAQDQYEQYEQHVEQFTSLSFGTDVTEGEQRYLMLHSTSLFDQLAITHLDIPLYKNPFEDKYILEREAYGELIYDTAMVFFDNAGEAVFDGGGYSYLTFRDEAAWFSGSEEATGHTYIDMDRTDCSPDIFKINFADAVRLTGYFDGSEFVLLDIALCDNVLPTYNPDKLTIGQFDKNGYVKWEDQYEGAVPTDRQTVNIYCAGTSVRQCKIQSDPVTVDGRSFESMTELVMACEAEDNYLESDSLWQSVIVSKGYYGDTEGNINPYVAAIRCYPLLTTMRRLANLYLFTLLPVVVILLLIRWRINRELSYPLGMLLRYGKRELEPLWDPVESRWHEPYELEQGYIQTQQLVHRLKTENKQLQTALEYARNAEEHRRQMISNITHELKTPLAVIHSYAEGLQDGIAAEKQEQYLGIILEETRRMDGMVLEMLDLSRLEAGKVRLSADSFSLAELTRSIFDKLALSAEEKNLQIRFGLTEDFLVTADESRIGQVITNFATNAIKYSPDGGTVTVCVLTHRNQAIFTIENACPRLSDEALSKVWDSFYRADPSRTTKGTGLGLTIAKAIVELHRGSCSVQNTSTGVEFRFSLPL